LALRDLRFRSREYARGGGGGDPSAQQRVVRIQPNSAIVDFQTTAAIVDVRDTQPILAIKASVDIERTFIGDLQPPEWSSISQWRVAWEISEKKQQRP
jgi:hypothetical protein